MVFTGKSQTSGLLYWPCYCLVNMARSQCKILPLRPHSWLIVKYLCLLVMYSFLYTFLFIEKCSLKYILNLVMLICEMKEELSDVRNNVICLFFSFRITRSTLSLHNGSRNYSITYFASHILKISFESWSTNWSKIWIGLLCQARRHDFFHLVIQCISPRVDVTNIFNMSVGFR